VLPPMEILFKDKANARPVYDFQIKQEWEKHVSYQCPAHLTPAELKAIERVCRETFDALDCRDVARVDLRMTAKGDIYVIEVNPLPGLTPGYSDLCLIAQAAGIEYPALIGEILDGGLRRLREKRREAKAEGRQEAKAEQRAAGNGGATTNGNGGTAANGNGGSNANGNGGGAAGGGNGNEKTPGPAVTATPSDDTSAPQPE
jgi:D-alanine-D-alanine ligase